jgi:hypothetical protein
MSKGYSLIGIRTFKSKTTGGDLSKWSVTVCENGISVVEQIIYTNDKDVEGFKILTTRFGKQLQYRRMTFKYGSLCTIMHIVNLILKENNVKNENIER